MGVIWLKRAACALSISVLVGAPTFPALSQQAAAPAGPAAVEALSWPRDAEIGPDRMVIYQPQIEAWSGDRIAGRAAIALGPDNGSPTYGVAHFTARTSIDKTAGLVTLNDLTVDKVDVPTAPAEAPRLQSALQSRIPAQGMVVALDHLVTSYSVAQEIKKFETVEVKNEPPRVVFAMTPTVLVPIDGTPVLAPVTGAADYRHVVNSRVLILADRDGLYHVHAEGTWYEARDLAGPWAVALSPAESLTQAADALSRIVKPDPVLPADGKAPSQPPAILVATSPTEIILTDGEPKLEPVAGTGLLSMSNADHGVFVDPANNDTYVLISGRWFRSKSQSGPWSFVPGNALPADFAKISPHDPRASVLVSVPGTPEAKEAVIAATIPQTATVERAKARLDVAYAGGQPKFAPIEGTALNYAANTPVPVIELDPSRYYAVSAGVWFVAEQPTGPWVLADVVPEAIYAIPPSSPLHYVTYVRVYATTADAVVVGYTPGYLGVVIDPYGTVVYGTGYSYAPYVWNDVWYGYPWTYGYGAGFAVGAADGFAFGFAAGAVWGAASPYWGPYWGWAGGYLNWQHVNVNEVNVYGRWGGVATFTHAYGWNGGAGFGWSGSRVSGFNPYTGARGVAERGGAFDWRTGGYAAGRAAAGYNPTTGRVAAASRTVTGNAYTGQRSVDSRGVVADPRKGNGVAWDNGHVYADHDGNVYQHTENGWQRHTSNGWQSLDRGDAFSQDLDRYRQADELGDRRFDLAAQSGQFDRDGFGGFRGFGRGGFGDRFGGFDRGGFGGFRGFRR
jgi:hypothetical protein